MNYALQGQPSVPSRQDAIASLGLLKVTGMKDSGLSHHIITAIKIPATRPASASQPGSPKSVFVSSFVMLRTGVRSSCPNHRHQLRDRQIARLRNFGVKKPAYVVRENSSGWSPSTLIRERRQATCAASQATLKAQSTNGSRVVATRLPQFSWRCWARSLAAHPDNPRHSRASGHQCFGLRHFIASQIGAHRDQSVEASRAPRADRSACQRPHSVSGRYRAALAALPDRRLDRQERDAGCARRSQFVSITLDGARRLDAIIANQPAFESRRLAGSQGRKEEHDQSSQQEQGQGGDGS